MNLDFVAIDVETANPDMSSICQIGTAVVRDGVIADEWTSYINPEDDFHRIHSSIHGIGADAISEAPTFPDIVKDLYALLDEQIVICHSHFDRTAIRQTATKYGIDEPNATWIDTLGVARRAWPACAQTGYGLSKVCEMLGYEFKHHDALEDAKAAAMVMLAACKETNIGIDDWIRRVQRPINPTQSSTGRKKVRRDGNPEGLFFGDSIVFTGILQTPRWQAADMAAEAGFTVVNSVTTKTSVLVVGDKNLKRTPGDKISIKQRKAEDFAVKGYPIRIVKETDFVEMIKLANQDI